MAKYKKVIKEQKKLYQDLQELHEEMRDFLSNVLDEQRRDSEELRYLKDFIHYQELEEEYLYFRRNAHEEEDSDLPFPYLTL